MLISRIIILVAACALIVASACTGGEPQRTRGPEGSRTPRAVTFAERIEAELEIDSEPDWVAVAAGSVWVARDEAGALARIDPETNAVVATVEVGEHPCTGLAAGFGAVWSPSCGDQALYRVDPDGNKVEAVIDIPVFQTFSGEGPFGGIATGAGAVWTITEGKSGSFDVLARVDPKTNDVDARIPLGYQAGSLTVADGSIWVVAPGDGRVLRVDPRRREVVVEVTGLAQPSFIDATEGALWVLSTTWPGHPDGDGSVTRIDTTSNEVSASVRVDELPGVSCHIVADSASVWARTGRTVLAEIDPGTNEIVQRIDEARGCGSIALGFGSLWLSDFTTDHVWRLSI